MIFYALTSTGCQGRCWNLNLKVPEGPSDVNVLENHFWSLFLHKNILSLENFGENVSKSSFFPVTIMVRKGMLPANVLKTPLPGQMKQFWHHEIMLATVHITDDDPLNLKAVF